MPGSVSRFLERGFCAETSLAGDALVLQASARAIQNVRKLSGVGIYPYPAQRDCGDTSARSAALFREKRRQEFVNHLGGSSSFDRRLIVTGVGQFLL